MSKGKDLGKRVVRRSEDVGRDVKTGMSRAGTKLSKGAHTLGHDARRAGTKTREVTERGWARASARLKRSRSA